jgi:hypothetical protein
MKEEAKILHWLMRSSLAPFSELNELAQRGIAKLGASVRIFNVHFPISGYLGSSDCENHFRFMRCQYLETTVRTLLS